MKATSTGSICRQARSRTCIVPTGKQITFWRQWTYGPTIAFLEPGSRPDEVKLVTLDKGTNKTARYVFTHAAFPTGTPSLVGTDVRDGKRFWICLITRRAGCSSLRLWEDGRAEEILVKGRLETANFPYVINGLLVFLPWAGTDIHPAGQRL